ncbi:alpha/beta hydrolase family protein [Pelagicoccus albus]|uniref:Alpha/beta hydrolase family protein n=1 Tax=Pelagicoccus albus TaxID=415222 RepID=A0A7X1B4F4_9BACT|nr:hypothetical protein [Pelagicoccus albus]MBC2605229.1 hypothetical protein [Pelagicoccus albus]
MKSLAFALICLTISCSSFAQSGEWYSNALGHAIDWKVIQQPSEGESITILKLGGLPEFQAKQDGVGLDGSRVIEFDYRDAPEAIFPYLSRDIQKLRNDLFRNELFKELDLDYARIFILPEGYGLKPDVLYFVNEQRPLLMDIAYPLDADGSVPCVLEFSCDNTDRMGNFSLAVCRDTLLEGFATAGYAFAMADHPVPPPYKGLDPMVDCIPKIKAATRTLRGAGRELGLSDDIAVAGFSRGSGMALALVTTEGNGSFEVKGEYPEEDDTVQAAIVLSGRFTYLNLLKNDKMWPRYLKAWGESDENPVLWKEQGALDYLEGATKPLFLSINSGEGPDAQHQMSLLRQRLTLWGSPYRYATDSDGLGHKVPLDPVLLESMRDYLRDNLN